VSREDKVRPFGGDDAEEMLITLCVVNHDSYHGVWRSRAGSKQHDAQREIQARSRLL